MIVVKNLSIETRKGRKLVENLSFTLNPGDKLAVIGEEGNGKSTILKAIVNPNLISDYCIMSGNINTNNATIGYLEQKLDFRWGYSYVVDYFLKDSFDDEFNYENYNLINQIKIIFKNLGLNPDYLDEDMEIRNLSGGEQVKLQLAKLMLTKPDVIFLDEPTNDLDIHTLEKLEDFINSTQVPVMYISHDETLLENTATAILHIEQLMRKTKPKHTLKKGSYTEYISDRRRSIDHQTQVAYSERREKDKKEETLRQIKQKVENALASSKKNPSAGRIIAKKMANIKAQERRNDNEELTEVPDVEEAINLIVDPTITVPSQKRVLEFRRSALKAGDKTLSQNIALDVVGPEKIAIVGNNGCGKTTLLRTLLEELRKVPGINVGYFSQNYSEVLDYNQPAYEQLYADGGLNPMTLLGSLKFTAEEMQHCIKDLSEGQKAKICLMKLIVDKNNVLVLDEPTRNLSPLSNPIIREILKEYNGAIITVSHDRKFIKEICDSVYVLSKSGLKKMGLEHSQKLNTVKTDNFSL